MSYKGGPAPPPTPSITTDSVGVLAFGKPALVLTDGPCRLNRLFWRWSVFDFSLFAGMSAVRVYRCPLRRREMPCSLGSSGRKHEICSSGVARRKPVDALDWHRNWEGVGLFKQQSAVCRPYGDMVRVVVSSVSLRRVASSSSG